MTQAEFNELVQREMAKRNVSHGYSNPANNEYLKEKILEEQGLGVNQLIHELKKKFNTKK